jgi:hypothetical protein
MDSTDLYSLFRSDVRDMAQPYLWSDDEVYAYMNDAYLMYFRYIGGIGDVTSSITQLSYSAGDMYTDISPTILQVRAAYRVSDERELTLINFQDVGMTLQYDYGVARNMRLSSEEGTVTAMIIGMEPNKVRWVKVPDADDTVQLHVFRLPDHQITAADQEFVDLDERHHIHLLEGMKARAYMKQDAETFNPKLAAANDAAFREYCEMSRLEWERYKHKPRTTRYGGI